MSFVVRELPKARQDKDSIFRWLNDRSPAGGIAWLDAYDSLVERFKQDVTTFGLAPESQNCEFEVRQGLFKTRRVEFIECCSSSKASRYSFSACAGRDRRR